MAEQDLEQRLGNPDGEVPTSQETESIDDKVEDPGFSFGRLVKDAAKFSPWAGLNYAVSALAFGAGSAIFLTPVGLTLGRMISNYKKGKKSTYTGLWNTTKVGTWGATLGIAAYSIPDYIFPGTGLLATLGKVALFDGVFVPAWLTWYRPSLYIADNKGTDVKNYTTKLPSHLKEAYHKDIKKKLVPQMKETAMTLSPIHFMQFYFVESPLIRLAIGTMNDVLLSMVAGEEGVLKTLKRRFGKGKSKKPDYQPVPTYNPSYAT